MKATANGCLAKGASGDASSVGEDKRNARKIYVGNLPPNITERPINDYFSQFGEVCDCKVGKDTIHAVLDECK